MSGGGFLDEPNPLGEQLEMTYRDVSRFDDCAELSDGHQRKVDYLLGQYRKRMAVVPIEHEGVLGGPDGSYAIGNANACHLSHRGSDELPEYDPDNPSHTQVPFIVPAWNPDHEWAVRAPDTIEDIIGGFAFGPDQPCDWHFGPAKPGTQPPAVMIRTQGQIILLLHVCGSCRDILTRTYGNGLLFFELDSNRRIAIPTAEPDA
jgi:hypothetical protein